MNYFDKALRYIGSRIDLYANPFVINIGAMDGVMFDEMIGYTNSYGFTGLYVEPIPYLFEKLEDNLGNNFNNIFENSAISDFNGDIEMLTIDKEAIDSGKIHNCFYGMSAVYPPKNGLGSEGDKETVEKYGKKITVPCITFETLMDRHTIRRFDVLKIDAEGHDYVIFKQIDLKEYKPSVIRIEYINLTKEEQKSIRETFEKNDYKYQIDGSDIVGIKQSLFNEIFELSDDVYLNDTTPGKVTIVTGIWNISRSKLKDNWKRDYEHYLDNLAKLMKTPDNMIIYIQKDYRWFVEKHREKENTLIIERELDWFKNNSEIYDNIQNIRLNPDWYNQSAWLPDSTQARLGMYNPIVMSKIFLLNDAAILDPFDSTHLVWVDGALTNTVHEGYFWKDKVIEKLDRYFDKFTFVSFPYDGKVEIHGFEYSEICQYAEAEVDMVARGGIFGGPKRMINEVNNLYYGLLRDTLANGLMGTEESIFTIMLYKYPELFSYYEIEKNGLLSKFFEDLKNDTLIVKQEAEVVVKNDLDTAKVGLYVITFNSPNQFEKLLESMNAYDPDILTKTTQRYLLNNSTDEKTLPKYNELCDKYGFNHIVKDNLGICGGRQFIAEHFDKTDLDYMWFSEDDMFFQSNDSVYTSANDVCRNGFPRHTPEIFRKSMEIIKKENFDFLKLNFSEFFGHNGDQWSWYNLPQKEREEFFPDKPRLPKHGLGIPPKTKFNNIKSLDGLPYVDGEIYYCNWTQIVSKTGNKKMFLTTKWAHPHEQTWMSYIFQETKKGNINPGLLLLTPIEHDRFDHYDGKLRKES